MRNNLKNASRVTLHVLAALVLLSACAFRPKVSSEVSPDIDKYHVKTVVVLPFDALITPQVTEHRPYDEITTPRGAVRSDMSLQIPPSGERRATQEAGVTPAAAEKVTRSFFNKLKNREGLNLHSPDAASAALKSAAGEGGETILELRAAKVAARMSLDAAIIGRVLVYQERKGSKLGGDTAAVGFEIKLVSADGTLLWTGNYYEKQKPFVQDAWGAFHRWFMFVTADELVEYGTTKLADRFPFGAEAKR